MKKKFSHVIAHYLPQCLLLISLLTSNVLFPATVIAQEIENTNNVTQEETVPIDTSEDILEEGISTNVFEETEVETEKEIIEEEEVVEPLFVFENGIYTVKNVVEGEEYVYPDNNDVRVKFTEVTQEGNLVIKRVELTEEQKELLNTKDSYGWDITSSMENGTFKYNLTLPNTQGNDDIEVKYTEDNNTYESIDNSNIEIKSNVVTIEGLEHFTIFVVSGVNNTGSCDGATITAPTGTTACYSTIQAAINNANSGDTINLSSDFTITQQININKSLILNGNNHKIFSNFTKTGNVNNSAIGIFANNVTLNDLTVDGSNGKKLHGINVYEATNVVLNNVTLKNNKKAGLVVNGSNVKVNNIKTSNNGWYAINVDQGENVNEPAILTVEGTSSHHNESYPIFVDDIRKDVTVKQNNQYYYVNLLFYRRVYRLDKISPSVPVLVSPIGGISINDNTPLMLWKDSTDFETGVSGYYLEIYSNCTNFNDVLTCQTVHSYTTEELSEYQVEDTLPENTYLWRVKAVDKAGNESNWSNFGKFTIDTPPEFSLSGIKYTYLENGVSKTEVQDRYITNWNTPVFVGNLTSTDIASVKVVINGIGYPATINKNDMTWEATISSSLLDGSYNVEIIATDLTGNTSTIEKYLFIDTKAPTAIFKHYKDNTEINETTNPVTYVKDISQLSFTGEYSDPGQSSGLYQDSFVIFQAQDDGSFAFQNNGKAAYCSWKGTQNTINLTDSTYSLTDPVSFTECTSTLPDGTYYMAHQVYDRATNKDIPSIYQFRDVLGLHFIVDNTAPTIPTATFTANGVSVPTNGYTRSKTFTFNLSSSEDTTRYQLKYWNNILGSPYKESNPWNPTDLSGYSTGLGVYNDQFMQGEGKHYFSFSACDAVGNCSAYSDPFVVTYDETPPSVPALESPIGGAYIKDNTPLMQWANSSDDYSDVKGYYYRVFHNCADISDSSTCSGVYPYLTGLWRTDSQYQAGSTPDGMYYWQVMAEDNAGNKSSWSNLEKVTIDTTAPEVKVISHNDGDFVHGTVTITGEISDINLSHYWFVIVDLNGTEVAGPGTVPSKDENITTSFTWDTTKNVADGKYIIKLEAKDLAGNKNPNEAPVLNDPEVEGDSADWVTVIVDNNSPIIEEYSDMTLIEGAAFPTIGTVNLTETNPEKVYISISDSSDTHTEEFTATSTFLLEDSLRQTIEKWKGSPFTTINLSVLPEGTYTISYYATDKAGNKGNEETFTITIVNNVPTVTITAGSTQITQGNSTVLGATAKNGNPPYTYQWSGACTGTESTTTFTGASTGTYTCTVTVTDADGDTASDSIDITVGAVLGATDGATTGSSTTSTNKPTTTKTNVSTYALGIGSGEDTLEQGEETLETTSIIEEPSVLGERCENKKKVSGYVYIDKNKDKEMNDNEEGIKDITLTIKYTDDQGNTKTEEEVSTDEKGYWEVQLCSGKYSVVIDQNTLPKNIEIPETLSLTVSDNEKEIVFNIQALDTRNFWQKYWYLIVGGIAVILIAVTSIKNKKKEEV